MKRSELRKLIKEELLSEVIDIDTAYNKLHDALVNVNKALEKHGDKKIMKAFHSWWGELDNFYPKK
jgi:hypothetical protein